MNGAVRIAINDEKDGSKVDTARPASFGQG